MKKRVARPSPTMRTRREIAWKKVRKTSCEYAKSCRYFSSFIVQGNDTKVRKNGMVAAPRNVNWGKGFLIKGLPHKKLSLDPRFLKLTETKAEKKERRKNQDKARKRLHFNMTLQILQRK